MIAGLSYIKNWISTSEAQYLLDKIDAESWITDFKRRVQHYGYLYDYKRRAVTPEMNLGKLPHWSDNLVNSLLEHEQFGIVADQMIINEYLPGQGIAAHIDCEPCFGNVIASLSLNSTCLMNFRHTATNEAKSVLLEPNSLLIMSGESRYDWTHGIPARQKDRIDNNIYTRNRRVSITFRKVILSD